MMSYLTLFFEISKYLTFLFVGMLILLLLFTKDEEGFAGEFKPDLFASSEYPCCRLPCVQ